MRKFEHLLPKEIIKRNEPISGYTTFGIGGKCSALLLPRNKKELVLSINACKLLKKKFQVIGNGSNILASSKDTRRVFIVTTNMEKDIVLHQNSVIVPSGMMIGEFILWCKDKGLSGLEGLFGIPATVGGAVMMNASAFGVAVFDVLESIEVYDDGKIKIINKEQIDFGHHTTSLLKSSVIILSVEFQLKRLAPSVIFSKVKEVIKKRQASQPKGKCAGCVFRAADGIPAGKIIDDAGLKGLRVGGAVVSDKHANFIINDGYATDQDVKQLIDQIQFELYTKQGITFEREIEYIGERDDYYR